MPRTRLGQHFLKDPGVAKKIVAAAAPQAGETILEIGPGRGALTLPLLEACTEHGAKLVAIERDEKLAAALEDRITVIRGDALALLPSASSQPADKIVGNLPYYITGHLFRVIGDLEKKPSRCVFMVQEEVAERICAAPPRMNRLAASVQFWAKPSIIAHVSKKDFSPSPKVDSAVVLLETRQPQPRDHGEYYAALKSIFAQPRKTLLNNLAGKTKKEEVSHTLARLNIDPRARPQNLTVEDIRLIAKTIFQ